MKKILKLLMKKKNFEIFDEEEDHQEIEQENQRITHEDEDENESYDASLPTPSIPEQKLLPTKEECDSKIIHNC